MTTVGKYRFLSAAIILLFVSLLAWEVPGRWETAANLWSRVREQQTIVGTPEQLERRRDSLKTRWKSLKEQSFSQGEGPDRTQAGLLEFLHTCSRSSGVRLESVATLPGRSGNHWQELPFRVQLRDGFPRVGSFISTMENAVIPVRMTKGEIVSGQSARAPLDVRLEAVAYLHLLKEER